MFPQKCVYEPSTVHTGSVQRRCNWHVPLLMWHYFIHCPVVHLIGFTSKGAGLCGQGYLVIDQAYWAVAFFFLVCGVCGLKVLALACNC